MDGVEVKMNDIIIGVVSILAGFVTIWINEILTHKRDIKHKREDMLLSHLKEMIDWLNAMQRSVFYVSDILVESIGIYSDADKKKQLQKTFNVEANELVERSIIFSDSYAELNNSLGIDLELGELNRSVAQFTSDLREIQKEYIFPAEDNEDLNKVNEKKMLILQLIRKRVDIISKEISKLLVR